MNELALFAKHWKPGRVKTRLAAQLGHALAAELYYVFVTTLMARLQKCGDRRFIVYSPLEAAGAFRELREGSSWQLRPQADGSLGQRLSEDVRRSMMADTTALVVLGTDSPTVPLAYVEQAFASLTNHDVVLGPTEDGGYYLIGLRNHWPSLFHGIDWSTSRVWRQTIERALALSASIEVLPSWYDVDRPEDLRRLRTEVDALVEQEDFFAPLAETVRRAVGC